MVSPVRIVVDFAQLRRDVLYLYVELLDRISSEEEPIFLWF